MDEELTEVSNGYGEGKLDMEQIDIVTGCSDCIICGRSIMLCRWHGLKDTLICKECRERLKKLLYDEETEE